MALVFALADTLADVLAALVLRLTEALERVTFFLAGLADLPAAALLDDLVTALFRGALAVLAVLVGAGLAELAFGGGVLALVVVLPTVLLTAGDFAGTAALRAGLVPALGAGAAGLADAAGLAWGAAFDPLDC